MKSISIPGKRQLTFYFVLLLSIASMGCSQTVMDVGRSGETCQFSFDIKDLVTDQQFPGQKNSFHVLYEYDADYQGGGFDAAGHQVSSDTYPYFQLVRNDIIEFARHYPQKTAFYEIFAHDLGNYVIGRYPQMRWVQITIEVPAFAGVDLDRKVTLTVSKKPTAKSR